MSLSLGLVGAGLAFVDFFAEFGTPEQLERLREVPLFGGGKKARSIRQVADWEKSMSLLGRITGQDYEVASSTLPLGLFGHSKFEIIRDKKHVTTLYPSYLNSTRSFYMHRYVKEPLGMLDVGFAPDGTGKQLVGMGESFADRWFVDNYVDCMNEVYKVPWNTILAFIHRRAPPLPIFLVSDTLSIAIAPYLLRNKQLEPMEKYQPS